MASAMALSIPGTFSRRLAWAAAPLSRARAAIRERSMRRPDMGKFSTARWVCADHLAFKGTRTSPIESCSVRYSVMRGQYLFPAWGPNPAAAVLPATGGTGPQAGNKHSTYPRVMRRGLMIGPPAAGNAVDGYIDEVKRAAEEGFASVWTAQLMDADAVPLSALAGREVADIEIGTAVVPTYPRHPLALASHALTAQAACRGRFVLGIGLSHQIVIGGAFGFVF